MANSKNRAPPSSLSLCCIGSKCSPTTTHAAFFNTILQEAGDATSTLKEVIKGLQEDMHASDSRQPLGFSKRAIMKKLVSKLIKISTQLSSFQTQMQDLKENTLNLQKTLNNQEDCPQLDVIQKMDNLASNMQEALKRLQEENELKTKVASNVKDGRKVSFNPTKPAKTQEAEMEQYRLDMSRLAASEEQLRAENERLKKEVEQGLLKHDTEISVLEQVERYKEVIARVTADNMVFLMKLKQSEEALQIAQEQQFSLTKQLEIGRLKLLEEVSAEIEDTVKASLGKAESCEKELQTLQKEHERKMREWQEKMQEARETQNQASMIKERLKEVEEDRVQILTRLDIETKKKEDALLENHALYGDIKKLTEQLSQLRAEHDVEMQELQDKVRRLESKEQEMEQLVDTLNMTSAQLETQHAINVVLMKKKEEMEWFYLEAKAEKENLQKQFKKLMHD